LRVPPRPLPTDDAQRYVRDVLLLSKPPYLRWAGAAALVIAALAWDVSAQATEPVPFAVRTIERGEQLEEAAIEWRSAPVGLIPLADLDGATAAVTIRAGEPISTSALRYTAAVPAGWWTVALDLPPAVLPGTRVRIVLGGAEGVSGVVVEPSREDSFGLRSAGLVAVPSEVADAVGFAAGAGQIVILFEP
jgi:hypothetical protein